MSISGTKVAILATHGFEQAELEVPRDRLTQAGAHVDIISPEKGEIRGWDMKDWGRPVAVDRSLDEAKADDYDALVLPGSQINPDLLRINAKALHFILAFDKQSKTIAAVCHAPWLLIETDLASGLKATSYKSIKTDMINAGAEGGQGGRRRRPFHHLAQSRRSRSLHEGDHRGLEQARRAAPLGSVAAAKQRTRRVRQDMRQGMPGTG
jgi:protease I